MMTDREIKFARHITELAAAFDVHLKVEHGLRPDFAGAGTNVISGKPFVLVAPVTDETTYAVALHELGHCIDPMGHLSHEMTPMMRTFHQPANERDVLLQLESERAAWRWAKHHALEWTPVMAYVKAMTLGTYERQAARLLGRKV